MPTKRKVSVASVNGLFPGENSDIRKEAAALIADSEEWLNVPNASLGGKTPNELIGTEQEQFVRDILRRIKHGIPT